MDPVKEALPFIKNNLQKYGLEWVNKGRISENLSF